MPFLPVSASEIKNPDFVIVTGDAYVCHPSFGAAVIGRVLQSHGYSVAVLAQPDWKTTVDFARFGRPRLGFLVTGGNIDSMVNHYTVALHKRKTDAYSPGGAVGLRPNRASIVYSNKIREVYKDVPIILGGLEASLRRMAHYDYWDNAVRRSILLDAAADLLVYGMGERQIVEIADALASGLLASDITFIDGTVFKTRDISFLQDTGDLLLLPPFKAIKENTTAAKKEYARSFMLQHENAEFSSAQILAEEYPNVFVVQNRPANPLSEAELDRVYSLPFMRDYHPSYKDGVPAIEEVTFSITAHRGCFGGCNFCSLAFHQGRTVQARSHKSIIAEAKKLTHDPRFKGYIHDVGGPTANFHTRSCDFTGESINKATHSLEAGDTARPNFKNEMVGVTNRFVCKRQCLFPSPCPNLKPSHDDYLRLLRAVRTIPGVKKVFVRSGIRYDYLLADPQGDVFLRELCQHHISGRLKVAPEHVSAKVLAHMGKPNFDAYKKFAAKFEAANKNAGKQQYLVPYLMSGHPGCTLNDAIEMAEYLQSANARPEQVQDFYPTPGTLSTCMYYTGFDPRNGKRVFVAKTAREKATQRALIQYRLPANREIVQSALIHAGRKDLIGHHPKALIRPNKSAKHNEYLCKKPLRKRKGYGKIVKKSEGAEKR